MTLPLGLRLTPRGIVLGVAAGLLVVAGLALGRREAIAIGVFLAAVLAVSGMALCGRVLWLRRRAVERRLMPDIVTAGQPVASWLSPVDPADTADTADRRRADTTLTRQPRRRRQPTLPPGLVETVPAALVRARTAPGPSAPVFAQLRLPLEEGTASWRTARRGRFRIGPAVAPLTAPFGLATVLAPVTGTSDLDVCPQPVDSAELDRLLRSGHAEHSASDVLGQQASPDDLLLREHRQGDPLARIHWGATARTGRIMVRQEELARDPQAVIVLDCRGPSFTAGRHRVDAGPGLHWDTSPDFETAVSLAAAVRERLERSGHQVTVVDQDGAAVDPPLVQVHLTGSSREATWVAHLPRHTATVVALMGTSLEQDVVGMRQLPRGVTPVAVIFGHRSSPTHQSLKASGWWVVPGPDTGTAYRPAAGRPAAAEARP